MKVPISFFIADDDSVQEERNKLKKELFDFKEEF